MDIEVVEEYEIEIKEVKPCDIEGCEHCEVGLNLEIVCGKCEEGKLFLEGECTGSKL